MRNDHGSRPAKPACSSKRPGSACRLQFGGLRSGGRISFTLLAVGLMAAGLGGGCSSSGESSSNPRLSRHVPTGFSYSQRVVADGVAVPKGGGSYKLGAPYQVAGRWYVPQEQPGYDAIGTASWYGADFHGRRTANGEIYDMQALTAAHPTLPLPSLVWVTNQANGRTLLVRVNDRGPYSRDRIIDLSARAARELGYEGQGTAQLRVRYAGPAPLDGNDARERQVMAQAPWRGGPMLASAPPQPQRVPQQYAQQQYAQQYAQQYGSPQSGIQQAGPRVPTNPPVAQGYNAPASDERALTDAYQPAVNAGAWSVSGYRQSVAGQRRSLGGPTPQ